MQKKDVFFIGVSGGTASGKTSVCSIIQNACGSKCTLISMDNFYHEFTQEELQLAHDGLFNFDHPKALDLDLLGKKLQELMENKEVDIAIYDFITHTRSKTKFIHLKPSPIMILEGIHALFDKTIRDLMDLKIFVTADDDVRLSRRIIRDIKERGREILGVLIQFNRFVKKSHEEFVKPCMKYADIILPIGKGYKSGTDLIVQTIKNVIGKRQGCEIGTQTNS